MSNPFDDLPPDEYDALLEDIESRGMVYPVIRDQNGVTIDGHQRERACAALGIVPHYRVVRCETDAEREALAVVLNTHRRHLTPQQVREAILRLAPTGMTQPEIGAAVGVSQGRVAQVIRANNPEFYDNPATWQHGHDYAAPEEPLLDKQGRPPESRGGRPRSHDPYRGTDTAPVWIRHFTAWARKALPEQRKYLVRIRDEADRAIALIDGERETA